MQSTEHYGYRLPQQGENARVTDLNFNTTKMDNIEYNTRRMIAPLHDINATYNTGDKVEEDGELCICKEDNVTGAFDPTQWDVLPVVDIISAVLSGTTAPSVSLGNNGDTYYQLSSGNIIASYVKISGEWLPLPSGGGNGFTAVDARQLTETTEVS